MIPGNERLVLIIGMAHSGTCIVTHLLRQHPDVQLVTGGIESWLLENDYLPNQKTDEISKLLQQFPDKRILLKRPWNEQHGSWMTAEMPQAKYVYCRRLFAEISKSWSKPTSFVEEEIRSGDQLAHYLKFLKLAVDFSKTVPFFRQVNHKEILADPSGVVQSLASWLGLSPFTFDVSCVGADKNIKALLWGDRPQKIRVLLKHGLGDVCMFSSVYKHLRRYKPLWEVYVEADKGKSIFPLPPAGLKPDQMIPINWPENWQSYSDCPSTKTTKCLKEVFGIKPSWDLLNYSVPIRPEVQRRADAYLASLPKGRGFVGLHYQGNTATERKNLTHETAKKVCDFLKDYSVILFDWDFRTPVRGSNVFTPDSNHPLWNGYRTGDMQMIAALMKRFKLNVMIDSGPGKVSYAVDVPSLTVWTRHHPIHYCDRADNCLHLVPHNHEDYVRQGAKQEALEFFRNHYRYETYKDLDTKLLQEIGRILSV